MREWTQRFISQVDVKKTVYLIFLFNLFDAFLTLFWINLGLAEELNPIMDAALDKGVGVFILTKIAMVGFGCLLIYSYRKNALAKIAAILGFAGYSVLMVYHSIGFCLAVS